MVASAGVSMCLAGCAGVSVAPDDGGAVAVDGIRYYEPAPFLLVYSDGKGGLKSELLYLPNTTKKRAIDPYAVLASNSSTLTFADGMLTGAKTEVDETVVPTALVESLKTVLAAAGGTLAAFGTGVDRTPGDPTAELPPPALFRIVHDPDGAWRLVGDRSGTKREGYGLDSVGAERLDIKVVQFVKPKPPADEGDDKAGGGKQGGKEPKK